MFQLPGVFITLALAHPFYLIPESFAGPFAIINSFDLIVSLSLTSDVVQIGEFFMVDKQQTLNKSLKHVQTLIVVVAGAVAAGCFPTELTLVLLKNLLRICALRPMETLDRSATVCANATPAAEAEAAPAAAEAGVAPAEADEVAPACTDPTVVVAPAEVAEVAPAAGTCCCCWRSRCCN